MVPANDSTSDTVERSAFIHREILQLGALVVVAAAAFLLTRAVAASNRDMNLRDAAEWYRRGQRQIEEGRVDNAVDAFRRATARNHNDKRYVLALARALALNRDNDAARSALLTLREAAPDDSEINLELARLAAARQDVTEGLRFYRNALYAPWPNEQTDARREVRFELVRFLLAHDRVGSAQSELLALSTDLPDEAALHLQVAQLFVAVGDNGHALSQYQGVLRLKPDSGEALSGAGQVAFQLGNYVLAQTYLGRAPMEADKVGTIRELVDVILSHDPLASRIGSTERRRRLLANLSYVRQRLNACLVQRVGVAPTVDEVALQDEAQAFEKPLKRPALLEQDVVETGVDLIDRIERHLVQHCGPPTALDQALVLIGRQHGAESR